MKTTVVPVGRDNAAHVEVARKLARRFNRRYGAVFPVPALVPADVPALPGILGRARPHRVVDVAEHDVATPGDCQQRQGRRVRPAAERDEDPFGGRWPQGPIRASHSMEPGCAGTP